MSIWQTVTWDVARAGGFTAFVLLTLSVANGLALSLHMQSPRWPRIINSELHNFLTLLALIFTGVHILAIWVDPFTSFGWNEVFIPFASHYRTVWMALGIVAFYIGIAIGISTWLRPRIGYKVWRALHTLTLLLFGLVVVHGIATGSDTRTSWGAAIYASSVVLVGTLLWMRLRKPLNAKSRAHPVLALAIVVLVAVGTVWTLLGPLQPGWASVANNGTASGSTANALAAPSRNQQQRQTTFPQSFAGNLQGQYTQSGPDANNNVTLQFNLSISNGPTGNVQMMLQGQSGGGDDNSLSITSSRVAILSSTGQQLFSGPLSNIYRDRSLFMTATLSGTGTNSSSQLQVMITVRLAASGQVTGTITAGKAIPAGSGVSE
jgi:Ferric reductase like transmembrane component